MTSPNRSQQGAPSGAPSRGQKKTKKPRKKKETKTTRHQITTRASASQYCLPSSSSSAQGGISATQRKSKYTVHPCHISHVLSVTNRAYNLALADRTRANYSTVVRNYTQFCSSLGFNPFPCSSLPVANFLAHYVISLGHSARSIPNILTALKDTELSHHGSWLTLSEEHFVDRVHRGLLKYDRRPVLRKLPLTLSVLTRMRDHLDLSQLPALQFFSMVFLAHDGLLRFSELYYLRLQDVLWKNLSVSNLEAQICIRISKTTTTIPYDPQDPYCNVHIELYFDKHGQPFCAAHYLRLYWISMGFDSICHSHPDASLFPRFKGPALAERLHVPTPKSRYLKILHSVLLAAGIDPSQYSGHSGRSGGATDLFHGQASAINIQRQMRSRSDAYLLYCRDNIEKRSEDISSAFNRVLVSGSQGIN